MKKLVNVMKIKIVKNMKARSSVVEHCFDVARVSGSIPLAPTSNVISITNETREYDISRKERTNKKGFPESRR